MTEMQKTNNENGTTTYRFAELKDFFTTDKAEAEAMAKKFNETGSWEQEK